MTQEKGVIQDLTKLDETLVSFAFVCRGTLEQFADIRSYILRMSGANLLYQTKSFERLRICRDGTSK